ncbi:MAG TPA: helix-turn-helix transcriptional regulator [Hyphomicrobiaceae bacterium]
MTTARLLPAVHKLFDAVTDAEKWAPFLAELAACFDAKGAQIVRVQVRERALAFSALYGFDDVILRRYGADGAGQDLALARYADHFVRLMPSDPRIGLLQRYPGRPLSCRLAISEKVLHASQAYREILDAADVEYTLAVNLDDEDGSSTMLGVFRGKASTHFTEAEAELFGELVPFVRQAIRISEHLARIDVEKARALEALDSIPFGILLATGGARVVQANATARRAIDLSDGLALRQDVLRLHDQREESRLHDAIRRAVARAVHGRPQTCEAVAVSRPSGKEPLSAIVTTLWGNHLKFGLSRLDEPLATVFLSIPEQSPEAPAELLQRLFGLTGAQARLCEQIVSGATLEQAAQRLQISIDTARVHLKRVFANVGVHRQSDLVAKVLATPVWIARQVPRDAIPARPRGIASR